MFSKFLSYDIRHCNDSSVNLQREINIMWYMLVAKTNYNISHTSDVLKISME